MGQKSHRGDTCPWLCQQLWTLEELVDKVLFANIEPEHLIISRIVIDVFAIGKHLFWQLVVFKVIYLLGYEFVGFLSKQLVLVVYIDEVITHPTCCNDRRVGIEDAKMVRDAP